MEKKGLGGTQSRAADQASAAEEERPASVRGNVSGMQSAPATGSKGGTAGKAVRRHLRHWLLLWGGLLSVAVIGLLLLYRTDMLLMEHIEQITLPDVVRSMFPQTEPPPATSATAVLLPEVGGDGTTEGSADLPLITAVPAGEQSPEETTVRDTLRGLQDILQQQKRLVQDVSDSGKSALNTVAWALLYNRMATVELYAIVMHDPYRALRMTKLLLADLRRLGSWSQIDTAKVTEWSNYEQDLQYYIAQQDPMLILDDLQQLQTDARASLLDPVEKKSSEHSEIFSFFSFLPSWIRPQVTVEQFGQTHRIQQLQDFLTVAKFAILSMDQRRFDFAMSEVSSLVNNFELSKNSLKLQNSVENILAQPVVWDLPAPPGLALDREQGFSQQLD